MSDDLSAPKPVAYNKPWISLSDQVEKLKSRGLIIEDRAAAEAFLHHVNYYRFTGYCLAFERPRHSFLDGTTFEQITSAYFFDVKLRQLIRRMLDWIEIDLRTSIAYDFGQAYGPFGHTVADNFHYKFGNRKAKEDLTTEELKDRKVFFHDDWLEDIHREAKRQKKSSYPILKPSTRSFPISLSGLRQRLSLSGNCHACSGG
jgi:abortive infection bacteriophage resistance protein